MSKTVKIPVNCPQCSHKIAIPVKEEDLGAKKQVICPKCGKKFYVLIPLKWASKFESDPTKVGDDLNDVVSLFLEVIPNERTDFQSFELTSDYYTIGRKNTSGPEYRPDVEVVTTDKKMSRIHAIIKKKGNIGFTIRDKDFGRTNGVILNGRKLEKDEEVYLGDGDEFSLGTTKFKVSFTACVKDDEVTVSK